MQPQRDENIEPQLPQSWQSLGSHPREPWGHPGDAEIFVHTSLDRMTGRGLSQRARPKMMEAYQLAKCKLNFAAAADVIENCWSLAIEDRIIDKMEGISVEPIIVFPHPSFDDDDAEGWDVPRRGPTNALPFQLANYLARRIGAAANDSIVQAARVGRTKLSAECRFIWQPSFVGDVIEKQPYILIDDVATTGGTLAALRSHIVRGGGTVIACTALAHKTAVNQKFAIADYTLSVVQRAYGLDIDAFWRETIGHDIQCITEAEAGILLRWQQGCGKRPGPSALLDLQDRLVEAASS